MHEQGILRKTAFWILLTVMSGLFLSGCATRTTIQKIRPAEISVGEIHNLGILNFGGPYGEIVRGDFYAKLAEVDHFSLIDPSKTLALDKVVYDQIDDPRFTPALEDLKADGVVTGMVTASLNDMRGTDQVSMEEGTGRYQKKKNIFGKLVDVEIKKTVLKPVPYIIRRGSLTAHFKLFNLTTKQIVATGKVTETYNEKFGGKEEHSFFGKKLSSLPARDATINDLSKKVANQLVKKISPTRIATMIQFDKGGTMGFGGNKVMLRGIEYATKGLWEEALEQWNEVIEQEPDNAAAYYNIGVAYESFGDLESLGKAKELYKKALHLNDKGLYLDAVARVNNSIKDRKKYDLQKQQMEQAPPPENEQSGAIRIY